MKSSWKGIFVATVTPFKNGEVDVDAFVRHLDRLLEANVHGICPAGTTGEGSTLSDREFALVVETALRRTEGKIPVVVGTGANDTVRTVDRTRLAKTLGADGALVVTPYYVKPTQEGLIRHYETLVKEVDLPMMMYNVPGRTAVNMLPETVEKLSRHQNIVALKECASLNQVGEVLRNVEGRLSVFSGEDGVMFPFLAMGGTGVVSVLANVTPELCVALYRDVMEKNLGQAKETYERLLGLTSWLFCQSNPIPVKAALAHLGIMENEVRSPLSELDPCFMEEGIRKMKEIGVTS